MARECDYVKHFLLTEYFISITVRKGAGMKGGGGRDPTQTLLF